MQSQVLVNLSTALVNNSVSLLSKEVGLKENYVRIRIFVARLIYAIVFQKVHSICSNFIHIRSVFHKN